MASFNSVVMVGRLVRDPEMKYVANGAPVCKFRIAASRRFTKSDGQRAEDTTFVDVDAWRRLAEICGQFLKKGRQVLIMGSLRLDEWLDAKTQQKRSKLKIVARDVQFLWSKEEVAAMVPGAAEAEELEEAEEAEEAVVKEE
ncbi:MAG TPA: single-stranded DNA-binding protein [Planctomycetota bacterium]|nr:single-stranded DNA-binding protein [Planctomycetota bacterium]